MYPYYVEANDTAIDLYQLNDGRFQIIREGTPVTLTSFGDGLRYMRFTDAVRRKLSS